MGLMGRLKVVVVKSSSKVDKHDSDDDGDYDRKKFHKPGRVDRAIENGKDYRSISYDDSRSVEDLLPVEEKKLETSELSKQLDYVLILNFDAPIPKP